MKLVDILARNMGVWPEGLKCLSQFKGTGYIINGKGFDGRVFDALEIADETHIAGAIVTRAEWQAAVDALNTPKEKVMDIDWSKAPEGATHFSPSCENYFPCWCKWVDGRLFGWLVDGDSRWTRIRTQECDQEKIKAMVARPVDEKWNGEGLPPVGTVCEYLAGQISGWREIKVLAIDGSEIWIKPKNFPSMIVSAPCEFRPIRSPEQIAAEELLKEAKEILDRMPNDVISGHTGAIVEWMLADGYRKQVKP